MKLLEPTHAKHRSPELPASSGTQLRPWLLAWLGLPSWESPTARSGIRPISETGELAAHQLSTATLLALMTAYIWALERRWPIGTSREAFTIGGSWALLTICSSSASAVTRDSWARLLGAYNLAEGQIWAVPLWTAVGPELIRRLDGRR